MMRSTENKILGAWWRTKKDITCPFEANLIQIIDRKEKFIDLKKVFIELTRSYKK